MVLGAQGSDVVAMIAGRWLILAAIDIATGGGLAYVSGRWLQALLVGVTPGDAPEAEGTTRASKELRRRQETFRRRARTSSTRATRPQRLVRDVACGMPGSIRQPRCRSRRGRSPYSRRRSRSYPS